MQTKHQYLLLSAPPEKEERFRELKKLMVARGHTMEAALKTGILSCEEVSLMRVVQNFKSTEPRMDLESTCPQMRALPLGILE